MALLAYAQELKVALQLFSECDVPVHEAIQQGRSLDQLPARISSSWHERASHLARTFLQPGMPAGARLAEAFAVERRLTTTPRCQITCDLDGLIALGSTRGIDLSMIRWTPFLSLHVWSVPFVSCR